MYAILCVCIYVSCSSQALVLKNLFLQHIALNMTILQLIFVFPAKGLTWRGWNERESNIIHFFCQQLSSIPNAFRNKIKLIVIFNRKLPNNFIDSSFEYFNVVFNGIFSACIYNLWQSVAHSPRELVPTYIRHVHFLNQLYKKNEFNARFDSARSAFDYIVTILFRLNVCELNFLIQRGPIKVANALLGFIGYHGQIAQEGERVSI